MNVNRDKARPKEEGLEGSVGDELWHSHDGRSKKPGSRQY
jgi:hypothetical protein